MKTAEFVSPKHPDKICDQIADAILDTYLKKDPKARVAVELLGGHEQITVVGEITADADVDIAEVVSRFVANTFTIDVHITNQSSAIAGGVADGGAGDQGIMTGYATRETQARVPKEYQLARTLCREIYQEFPYDGKTQVTIDEDGDPKSVVASFQHASTKDLEALVREQITADAYYINPAGEWKTGGFAADAGLSGRKVVVDNYGPEVPVGGGAFSGKDPTKVDRSGAYMARKIAVDYVEKYQADEVFVKLAYAIGKNEALMGEAFVDGKRVRVGDYDLRPQAIIDKLNLRDQEYEKTARWGHFGRGFSWE